MPLEHLAEYTRRLTGIFAKHGTSGTWYAHASVGCLHVRPILNLKLADEVGKMRAIAEEAAAMVREYKGAYSGEHGDGLVRSEFNERMFGPRLMRAFEAVKDGFDPERPAQSRQDRPRAGDGRAPPAALPAGLSRAAARAGARLAGLGRLPRRRRDVQQQRRLPQGRARRDVPVLPGDRATRRMSPAAAPTACGSRSAASSGRTRFPRTRWRRRSTSASPARPAGANARPASTWRG